MKKEVNFKLDMLLGLPMVALFWVILAQNYRAGIDRSLPTMVGILGLTLAMLTIPFSVMRGKSTIGHWATVGLCVLVGTLDPGSESLRTGFVICGAHAIVSMILVSYIRYLVMRGEVQREERNRVV